MSSIGLRYDNTKLLGCEGEFLSLAIRMLVTSLETVHASSSKRVDCSSQFFHTNLTGLHLNCWHVGAQKASFPSSLRKNFVIFAHRKTCTMEIS